MQVSRRLDIVAVIVALVVFAAIRVTLAGETGGVAEAEKAPAAVAWGVVTNGLQAGLVPLGGGAVKDWQRTSCGPCHAKRMALLKGREVDFVPVKCAGCDEKIGGRKFCDRCASATRVCALCGAAKPWGATFAEGDPLPFEVHLKNAGVANFKLYDVGFQAHWRFLFTPKDGGGPWTVRCTAEFKRGELLHVELANGRQAAFAVEFGNAIWSFEEGREGSRTSSPGQVKHLPPGSYTVTASYEHAEHAQFAKCPFWHGKVTTGPLEIEIKAKGAAGKAAAGAPDAATARKLAMQWIKDNKREEMWKETIAPEQLRITEQGKNWAVIVPLQGGRGVFGFHIAKDTGKILLPVD
jgi:hypothetical protein